MLDKKSDADIGRPTAYKDSFCEEIVEHMREGGNGITFAAKHNVTERTFRNWVNAHEDFFHAYSLGQTLLKGFLYKKLVQYLVDNPGKGKLNGHIFNKIMKASFGNDQTSMTYLNKDVMSQINLDSELSIVERTTNINKAVNDGILSLEEGEKLVNLLNKESEIYCNEQLAPVVEELERLKAKLKEK